MKPTMPNLIDETVRLEGADKNVDVHKGYRWWKSEGDTGGLTCAGLSKRWTMDEYLEQGLKPSPEAVDLWAYVERCEMNKLLPLAQGTAAQRNAYTELQGLVKAVYKVEFWDPLYISHMPESWRVRWSVYDAAVNCGKERVAKWVQAIVGAGMDGIIRSRTNTKIHSFVGDHGEDRFADAIRRWREQRYDDIVREEPAQKIHYNGWMRRASKVIKKAAEYDVS